MTEQEHWGTNGEVRDQSRKCHEEHELLVADNRERPAPHLLAERHHLYVCGAGDHTILAFLGLANRSVVGAGAN
jgi:hypothetical protein